MQTIANLTPDDLKQLIKESVKETFSENILKDLFYDVIENISFSKAIDQGMETKTIDTDSFMNELESRIQ